MLGGCHADRNFARLRYGFGTGLVIGLIVHVVHHVTDGAVAGVACLGLVTQLGTRLGTCFAWPVWLLIAEPLTLLLGLALGLTLGLTLRRLRQRGLVHGVQNAKIMLGMLEVALGHNPITRARRVTAELQILLKKLLRRTADAQVGPDAVEYVVTI